MKDVNNGIARRSWARNSGSIDAIRREMERTRGLTVTLANLVDENTQHQIDELFETNTPKP